MAQELSVTELPPVTLFERPVRRFELASPNLRVELMEYGATVLSVKLRTADSNWATLTRGLAEPEHYVNNPAYMGSVCGRYAGRINGASYSGPTGRVQLSKNHGDHQLHGGERGFNARFWRAEVFEGGDRTGVNFYYTSQDGEEGYPGTLDTCVRYSLDGHMRLCIDYSATAVDKATPVNLTNHCYWNLGDNPLVLSHELKLAARSVLELDANLLPTGASLDVKNTALDFSSVRTLSDAIGALPPGVDGLDHCLHDFSDELGAPGELDHLPMVAEVREPTSGRTMSVYTDQPLLVLYTGNALDGSAGHGGVPQHGGFCIECQQFPDAPNQPAFPSPFVGQGETYTQTSVYAFATICSQSSR